MKTAICIETVNLTKKFGELTAVNHINLEIRPGEIMGFLGPNGAGKTTAIRMICGLLKPDQGKVLFNGFTINQLPDGKSLLGVCPQENVHWERLTCLEQLVFMGEMYNMGRNLAKSRSIRNLAGSRTIILTTHNMDEADRLSDRVAIIDQGRILKIDTPDNLKKSAGTRENLQINPDKNPDNAGFPASEVQVHENTLEDVFILLTGKTLRS